MVVEDLNEYIFENYYKRIDFTKMDNYFSLERVKKVLVLLATNLMKKPPDSSKTK